MQIGRPIPRCQRSEQLRYLRYLRRFPLRNERHGEEATPDALLVASEFESMRARLTVHEKCAGRSPVQSISYEVIAPVFLLRTTCWRLAVLGTSSSERTAQDDTRSTSY